MTFDAITELNCLVNRWNVSLKLYICKNACPILDKKSHQMNIENLWLVSVLKTKGLQRSDAKKEPLSDQLLKEPFCLRVKNILII